MDRLFGAALSDQRVPTFILAITVVGAPLLFGSVSATAIAFWNIVLCAGLLSCSHRTLSRHQLRPLAFLLFTLLALGLVLHEQASSTPLFARFDPIWTTVQQLLGAETRPHVSIVAFEPLHRALPLTACLFAAALGVIVGARTENARYILAVFAWSALAFAVIGIIQLAAYPDAVLWREKRAYIGNLTGPFINRNTAAAYFGSACAVWLAATLIAVREALPARTRHWRQALLQLLSLPPKRALQRFIGFSVCLAALLMTASRAGVAISLLVLGVMPVMFFRRDFRRGRTVWGAYAASALGIAAIIFLLGGALTTRLEIQGTEDGGRFSAYAATLRIISDHPWLGSGVGSFRQMFPLYRPDDLTMVGVWDYAHNSYLQIAAEAGIPFTVLLIAGLVLALRRMLVFASSQSRRYVIVPFSVAPVVAIGALHSLIDFSLQIPGYAIAVSALLGCGVSQSTGRENIDPDYNSGSFAKRAD